MWKSVVIHAFQKRQTIWKTESNKMQMNRANLQCDQARVIKKKKKKIEQQKNKIKEELKDVLFIYSV